MSTELGPFEASPPSPPPMDEGYWAALMQESEAVKSAPPSERGPDMWESFSPSHEPPSFEESGDRVGLQRDWTIAMEVDEADETVELEVVGYNRGGLLVSWNSLRGFVPASQLVDFPVDVDETVRQESLSKRLGKRLLLRIIELDPSLNRLILSERAAQVEPGQRADVLEQLKAGETYTGTITNLCDFGAFVDLGGIEGLIHISEISWGRIGHPRDVLSSGQMVAVYVMSVDREEGRIALSLKRLQPDPWKEVESRYEVGEWVSGVITNVVDFGAFACIEDGLEGLIHVSELAEGQFLHPRNVVSEGETVRARILNIDSQARRLGLSLRPINSTHHSDNGGGTDGRADV